MSSMLMLVLAAGLAAAPVESAPVPLPTWWYPQVESDTLNRTARAALNRGEYQLAAKLFAELAADRSQAAAADAYYWQAFALYRLGGTGSLQRALASLETQRARFPQAMTRRDAEALQARIQAVLARSGDAAAAAMLAADAEAVLADAPRAPRPPRAPRAPRPPRAPRAPHGADICAGEDESDVKVAALNGLLQMDAERALPILDKVMARRDSASTCLRRRAVFLVAQKREASSERILLDAVRNDPDAEVRSQAVFWLARSGGERSVTLLDSILQKSTDAEVQERAVFALSQQGSPAATEALRRYARSRNGSSELRNQAVFWLAQRGSAELPLLRELYREESDADAKGRLLFAASRSGAEAKPFLLDVARDRAEPVEARKQAIFWLSKTDGVGSAELAGLYNTTDDRDLRTHLLFVLSQRKDGPAIDKLVAVAKQDPDAEVRKSALFWLGQTKDPRAAQVLQEILDQ